MKMFELQRRQAQSKADKSAFASVVKGRMTQLVAFGVALGMTGMAHATDPAAIDVSSVVATIATAVTAISLIGLAVLSLVVTTKTFKWAARAL